MIRLEVEETRNEKTLKGTQKDDKAKIWEKQWGWSKGHKNEKCCTGKPISVFDTVYGSVRRTQRCLWAGRFMESMIRAFAQLGQSGGMTAALSVVPYRRDAAICLSQKSKPGHLASWASSPWKECESGSSWPYDVKKFVESYKLCMNLWWRIPVMQGTPVGILSCVLLGLDSDTRDKNTGSLNFLSYIRTCGSPEGPHTFLHPAALGSLRYLMFLQVQASCLLQSRSNKEQQQTSNSTTSH